MNDMLRALRALFLGASLLLACFAAQAQVPPYDVIDAPVKSNKESITMEDVSKAINRAGASLGWKIEPAGPGAMVGTLNLRTHTAVVDIRYDTKAYSIKYKDSKDLRYDGKTIHRAYNGWVQNLDKAIRTQLGFL
jgi:hypothetical protein